MPLSGLAIGIFATGRTRSLTLAVCFAVRAGLFLLARGVARFNPVAWWIAIFVSLLQAISSSGDLLMTRQGAAHTASRTLSVALGVTYVVYFWRRSGEFYRCCPKQRIRATRPHACSVTE